MIKPIGNKILVETIATESSSIILLNPEKPQKGRVIALGKNVNKDIQEGMTVMFTSYAGVEIKDADQSFLLLEEKDILAYE